MKHLELRDRGIIGTDTPLCTDVVTMIAGESIDVVVPFDQVLPAGIDVSSVNSAVKSGYGVTLSDLSVSGRYVSATMTMDADAGSSHLVAIIATLATDDTWVINVPCARLDSG